MIRAGRHGPQQSDHGPFRASRNRAAGHDELSVLPAQLDRGPGFLPGFGARDMLLLEGEDRRPVGVVRARARSRSPRGCCRACPRARKSSNSSPRFCRFYAPRSLVECALRRIGILRTMSHPLGMWPWLVGALIVIAAVVGVGLAVACNTKPAPVVSGHAPPVPAKPAARAEQRPSAQTTELMARLDALPQVAIRGEETDRLRAAGLPFKSRRPGVSDGRCHTCGHKYCPDCQLVVEIPGAKSGPKAVTIDGDELHAVSDHGLDFSPHVAQFLDQLPPSRQKP
jgi:hypothetical protein